MLLNVRLCSFPNDVRSRSGFSTAPATLQHRSSASPHTVQCAAAARWPCHREYSQKVDVVSGMSLAGSVCARHVLGARFCSLPNNLRPRSGFSAATSTLQHRSASPPATRRRGAAGAPAPAAAEPDAPFALPCVADVHPDIKRYVCDVGTPILTPIFRYLSVSICYPLPASRSMTHLQSFCSPCR